jgi:DNA-binding NarL/FixJ family response regulator
MTVAIVRRVSGRPCRGEAGGPFVLPAAARRRWLRTYSPSVRSKGSRVEHTAAQRGSGVPVFPQVRAGMSNQGKRRGAEALEQGDSGSNPRPGEAGALADGPQVSASASHRSSPRRGYSCRSKLPGLSGLEATREILEARPDTAVLVLTMFEDDATVHAAIAAGALGYLLKGADGEDILAAVRSAAAGQAVFGAPLAHRMRTLFATGPTGSAASFPELTDREREILDKVAAGLTNAEIGSVLYLSPKTVANNVSMILAKLNLSERGQAIVLGRDAGLGRSDASQRENPGGG